MSTPTKADAESDSNPKTAQDEETGTSDYCYEDFPVELHVGGEVFKISSSRLSLTSPVFKNMFTLPQPGGKIEPIVLHNDVGEFKDYLWYIHADPFDAKDFLESPPSAAKCSRLIGFANTAFMYGAEKAALRAMALAHDMLTAPGRPFDVDVEIARRLLRSCGKWHSNMFLHTLTADDVICDAMYPAGGAGLLETDPIAVVVLCREFRLLDKTVLAHAYFYILEKGDAYWRNDARLNAGDRMRLLCGSHALFNVHKEHQCKLPDNRPRPTLSLVWAGFRVHQSIAHIRHHLWDLFDSKPWNLAS